MAVLISIFYQIINFCLASQIMPSAQISLSCVKIIHLNPAMSTVTKRLNFESIPLQIESCQMSAVCICEQVLKLYSFIELIPISWQQPKLYSLTELASSPKSICFVLIIHGIVILSGMQLSTTTKQNSKKQYVPPPPPPNHFKTCHAGRIPRYTF